jgi:replicative DNA helicase
MEDDILETTASYNTRLSNEALKKLALKEEPRFLSILLKNKECLMDCMAFGIKPGTDGHFWSAETRFFFGLIHEYYKKYTTILTRTAIDSVMDSINDIGGIKIDEEHRAKVRMYWDKIYNLNAPIEDYELLRDNINNRYVQWVAYELMKDELEKIARATNNQSQIVKDARERFFKIDNLDADSYTSVLSLKDGMDKVIEHITNRREHPEDSPAVMTGIKAIDDMYHGFPPSSYTLITGMINGGKTTLMFNIAFNMAKAGYGVVYVSLEKEAVPLFTRLLALHALTDYNRIKIGGKGDKGLSDYYYGKLMEAAKDLKENIEPRFECIQAPQTTKLSKIISEVERIKSRMKIDVLFVDYLGVIGFETHHPGRPDLDEAFTSQRLQAYGRINKFVTITASQLKTPSAKEIRNKSKKATADDASKVEINTEDLAGSKMIIADADAAIGVILNGDSPPTKMFAYGIKARDDESRRTVVLDFDGKLGRVSDPVLEPGQITEIDQLVYNEEISEESLKSDDGLFSKDKETEKTTEVVEVKEVKKPKSVKKEEDPFDALEEEAKVNPQTEVQEEQTEEKEDEFDYLT